MQILGSLYAFKLVKIIISNIATPYSAGSSWRLLSMHCLLLFTFVTFWILWPLSPAASSVSWYRSCLVLFWTYIWNIQWRWCLHVSILCGLLLYDSSPICKKWWAYLCIPLNSDDSSECPMDYEISLVPNVFCFLHAFSWQFMKSRMTWNMFSKI